MNEKKDEKIEENVKDDGMKQQHEKGAEGEGCGCSAGTNRVNDLMSATKKKDSVDPSHLLTKQILDILKKEFNLNELDQDIASKQLRERYNHTNPTIFVQGGTFTMGTDEPAIAEDGEGPARKVTVSDFLMQKYEVSNLEFALFVLETGYQTDAEKYGWSFVFQDAISPGLSSKITKAAAETPWWLPVNDSNWLYREGPDSIPSLTKARILDPVVHVSHTDARAFCSHYGMRLPREAEFEYVLKGGKDGKDDGRAYAWGHYLYGKEAESGGKKVYRANLWQGVFPKVNTGEDGYVYMSPVDSFGAQNEVGLYNIQGNVWEWVADAWSVNHNRFKGKVLENPQMELSYERLDDPTVERVKRGGSYMCHKSYCYRYRTVSRSHNSADSSAFNLGFRCANDVESSE